MKICKSINFIAWNETCQINYAEPDGNVDRLIQSVGNSFVATSTIPEEIAGSCKGHDCKVNEVCIPKSQNYICVPLIEGFAERGKLFVNEVQFYVLNIDVGVGCLVSHGKQTGQSTPYGCPSSLTCGAGAGVDGIKTTTNMFHTNDELEPFWWVNLGEVYEVQKVVSTNRIDCCGERIGKMLVHVGKSLDTSKMELCGQFIGPAVTGQVIVTPCITFPKGQWVKLTSVNAVPVAFHIVEVEVYGVLDII
ncbi:fucolectin-1-like [Mytilus trossulus]|uniref:fucolectin-1-like n=1 Tax=Mytilus trossulus TaxID=6551 RepID=UPI0030071057